MAERRSARLSRGSEGTESPRTLAKIWLKPQSKKGSDDENNENSDALNKMQSNQPLTKKLVRTGPADKNKKRERTEKHANADYQSSSSEDGAEQKQVSPPKQSRQQQEQKTPSLIRRTRLLSIDEHDGSEQAAEQPLSLEENLPSCNKYQNARRVLNSAETLHLPGREEQLQRLREFFEEHLREQRSGSLYVSGQPGTGKTACLSLLLRSQEFAKRLQSVYINCTSIASVGGVYKKLCGELQLRSAGRNERDNLAAIQRHLRTAPRMLLLVLDEIDQLCSARQQVLYTIFEWPALPGARLLLVGIANSLDLTDRALVRLNARCELKPRLMHFPPYSKQQIVDIFHSRLEEGGVLDVFPPPTLQLLAAKVSAVSGDVRRALDIGRRVVEIAEQQKKLGQRRELNLRELGIGAVEKPTDTFTEDTATLHPVRITQVASVLNKVYGASQNLQTDIEDSFPLQQKLMLCSLMLMLRNERHKDTTVGRLHEVYRRVCAKRNILALDQAEFAGLVELVETRGILRIVRKKEPRLSKVQLQWDEEEVNGALSDKQLIASILGDTACLSK